MKPLKGLKINTRNTKLGLHRNSFRKSLEAHRDIDKKRGYSINNNLLISLVGGTGIEPVTSTV
jgi:hypothetical protein